MQAVACEKHRPGLAIYQYPCVGELLQVEPLVLVHGWGSDSRIWQPLVPLLSRHLNLITVDLPGFGNSPALANNSLDDQLSMLAESLPEKFALLGWSLGGMLATAFAHRYPKRVSSLVTISSNACFAQRDGWPAAMAETTFAEFCEQFRQQPALCLKRFHGLQTRGDSEAKAALKLLREQFNQPGDSAWQSALELLGQIDNREPLQQLAINGLHLYGEADQLVPAAAATAVAGLSARQKTLVLEGVGHISPLSRTDTLADEILKFLREQRYHLDKQRVADSFSRAATSYDSVARLQRQVGQSLMDELTKNQPVEFSPKRIVDLGCGTGYFTDILAEQYPQAEIVGLDLAQGMLQYARSERADSIRWLCGDAEALPIESETVDFVFSSLALQWCEILPALAAEISRVLSPAGVLAFTSLGDETLFELRHAWSRVDDYVHVNHFLKPALWRDAFSGAGLNFQQFEVENQVLSYRDLRQLTHELKGLGAHNVNAGQNPGLTGREHIRGLMNAYETFRDAEGQLPATWQVIYGVATRDTIYG